MGNKSNENLVKASFIDENDLVFFKKSFSFETTILEILQISDLKSCIELKFNDVELLNYVELLCRETDKLEIRFDFNVDQLIPVDDPEEKKWRQVLHQLYSKLWSNENIIMEIFEVDELALLWGGSEPKVNSKLEVCYYIDDTISWIWFKAAINYKDINESYNLSLLDLRIKKIDALVKKIIEEILAEIDF